MSWLYGAEYWVPENYLFKSGSDCLDAFPDAGPACGIVSTTRYAEAIDALRQLADFTESFCEEVRVSKHYPSIEKARAVLRKLDSEDKDHK